MITWQPAPVEPVRLTPRGERVLAYSLLGVIAVVLALAFVTGQAWKCDRLLEQDNVSAQRIAEVCGGDSLGSRSWS